MTYKRGPRSLSVFLFFFPITNSDRISSRFFSIGAIYSSPSTTMINLFRQPILRTSLQASLVTSTKRICWVSTVTTSYSSFPASSLRYNIRQKSSLYKQSKCDNRGDDPYWDSIEISAEDGFIHPRVLKDPIGLSFI